MKYLDTVRPGLCAGLMLFGTTTLSGCAVSDRFGGRVVDFNVQMQQARQKVILNNILRAAYDEPLQFSEISTVSGQASVQGGLGTVLPFFGSAGTSGTRLFQLNPSAQTSGGPQFGVANTNTQEFFNGITAPLTMDQVATYVSNGKSRIAVLMLTVAAIDYDLDGKHYHFAATPQDLNNFRQMQSVLVGLINKRLTFERREAVTYVGPPLTGEDVVGRSVLQDMLKAPAEAKLPALKRYSRSEASDAAAWAALSPADTAKFKAETEFYRLTASETKTRLCFAPPSDSTFGYAVDLKQITGDNTGIGKVNGVEVSMSWGAEYVCSSQDKGDASGIKKLTFTFRSVRGIFELLGAIAREELGSSDAARFDVPHTLRLFGVERTGAGPLTAANVKLTQGTTDGSAATIQLLSEFVALNSSAKSIPNAIADPILYALTGSARATAQLVNRA